jgi:CTP:molybdopterin cytidylyltransferase MocA
MSEAAKSTAVVAGIILAGGASTRMGAPKPIMPWGDQTFVQAIIHKMKAAGVAPVLVVLGAHFREAHDHCLSCGATPSFHQGWSLGQFSSLQAGLSEASKFSLQSDANVQQPATMKSLMVALVDQPHIAFEVFREVVQVAMKFPEKLIIPTFDHRRGHPYVIPANLFSSILAMPPTATMRDFLNAQQSKQMTVPVMDPGILFDIDTPEDLLVAHSRYRT